MKTLFHLPLLAVLSLASCAYDAPADQGAHRAAFSFIVIGDTPYSDADEQMLAQAVPVIRDGAYPFIIHVGDYKGGRQPCIERYDERFAALVDSLAPTPVFYTPGDNEWTDCDRDDIAKSGFERASELERLDLIRNRFFSSPQANADTLRYERQPEQVENATWAYGEVRFATIHVVGTANGRDYVGLDDSATAGAAADDRDRRNLDWLTRAAALAKSEKARALIIAMQADPTDLDGKRLGEACEGASARSRACDAFAGYRARLKSLAEDFSKPVLLIHGDTAPFTLNRKMAGDETEYLWRLNAAGDAGVGYGVRDVTLVTIDADSETPFSAIALLSGRAPDE
ncbi:MAG: hypothetical protein KDE05_02730 [Parvularculaceae bacterium]|nr:hypothetical protein [Parvularculaceae bacterium]